MSTCRDFRKSGRGRPSLDLKCALCGVEYRSHGKGVKTDIPISTPKPDFNPVVVVSIGDTKPSQPRVSAEHLLTLFANQSGMEDW